MKIALITDFDGTITTFDVGDFLLLHFNLATREEIEKSYLEGVKVEEWMKIYFSRIKVVDVDRIKEVIKKYIKLRDGFIEVVEILRSKNMPVEIVSGGVDLYIDEVISNNNIKIGGFYGKFNYGNITFDFLNGVSLSDFKASRVEYYKDRGYVSIFCGDSLNDYDALKRADIKFATSRLYEISKKDGIDVKKLENFNMLLNYI